MLALTISFAMVLSYIESRIPAFVAIPGIKVGLANIAVIFTIYKFGIKEAITVSLIRVLLVSMLFGLYAHISKSFFLIMPSPPQGASTRILSNLKSVFW